MIPAIVENLIEQVVNNRMDVYQRQMFANTLRDIVDASNKALIKYEADFAAAENSRSKRRA